MTSTGYNSPHPRMISTRQMSQKEGMLPLLLGAASLCLIVLSPASLSPTIPLASEMKYFRVILTALIVTVGLMFAKPKFGRHSLVVAPFIIFFAGGALWSYDIDQAIIKKAFFPLSFFSGLIVVICLQSIKGVEDLIKKFAIASSFVAAFVLVVFYRDPEANKLHGRLSLEGINANHLAETAAPLFVVAFYAATLRVKNMYRWVVYSSLAAAVGLVVLFTGSRASLLEMIVGCSVFLFRKLRFSTISSGILFAVVAALLYYTYAESLGMNFSRFLSTEDTRSEVWKLGIQKFLNGESLLFGTGWAHNRYSMGSTNFLSIYLTILIESGIVGSVFFIGCFATLLLKQYSLLTKVASVRKRGTLPHLRANLQKIDTFCMCAIGLTMAVLIHGLFESSTMLGSTVNSFALGLAVGLGDQAARFIKNYENQ